MLRQSNPELKLTRIHSFYSNGNARFSKTPPLILSHDIAIDAQGVPCALAGRLLSQEEIDEFHSLVNNTGSEWNLVHPRLLAHRNHSHIWWSPARKRKMFFKTDSPELNALNGKEFYQPAVVFKNEREKLSAWALLKSRKPSLRTPLFRIPLYNINNEGIVCMPHVNPPFTPQSLEEHFWNSPYTHSNSAGKTIYRSPLSYPEYLQTLCLDSFPTDTLLPTQTTLQHILR